MIRRDEVGPADMTQKDGRPQPSDPPVSNWPLAFRFFGCMRYSWRGKTRMSLDFGGDSRFTACLFADQEPHGVKLASGSPSMSVIYSIHVRLPEELGTRGSCWEFLFLVPPAAL